MDILLFVDYDMDYEILNSNWPSHCIYHLAAFERQLSVPTCGIIQQSKRISSEWELRINGNWFERLKIINSPKTGWFCKGNGRQWFVCVLVNIWNLFLISWNRNLLDWIFDPFIIDVDEVTDSNLGEKFLLLWHDNEAKMANKWGYQVIWIHQSICTRYSNLCSKVKFLFLSYFISCGNGILHRESHINKITKLS